MDEYGTIKVSKNPNGTFVVEYNGKRNSTDMTHSEMLTAVEMLKRIYHPSEIIKAF